MSVRARAGLDERSMVRFGMVWSGIVSQGRVWCMAWYGMARYDSVWNGMVLCCMLCYGVVWYSMV